MKKFFVGVVASLLSSLICASSFPEKPVQIVVPTGAGGGLDVISRAVADKLRLTWNHGTVVMNKPGANGVLAINQVLQAPNDGYTLLFHSFPAWTAAHALGERDQIDWTQHFYLLSVMSPPPFVLVVNSTKNLATLSDLTKLYKGSGVTYGSTIAGSPLHMYGALVMEKLQVPGIMVPYKGVPQILIDLLSNQLDFAVLNYAQVRQHVQSGALTLLFVFDDKPLQEYTKVPYLAGSNFTEYHRLIWSYSFFVRKDTPDAIKAQLQRDIATATDAAWAELVTKNLVSVVNTAQLDKNSVDAVNQIFKKTATKLPKN